MQMFFWLVMQSFLANERLLKRRAISVVQSGALPNPGRDLWTENNLCTRDFKISVSHFRD